MKHWRLAILRFTGVAPMAMNNQYSGVYGGTVMNCDSMADRRRRRRKLATRCWFSLAAPVTLPDFEHNLVGSLNEYKLMGSLKRPIASQQTQYLPQMKPTIGGRGLQRVRAFSVGFFGGEFSEVARLQLLRGSSDPLDAFMVSVHREIDRQNKGRHVAVTWLSCA
eukprot:5244522-Amphidinium_carterae.1